MSEGKENIKILGTEYRKTWFLAGGLVAVAALAAESLWLVGAFVGSGAYIMTKSRVKK